MREVEYTAQFQRDFKREGKSPRGKVIHKKLEEAVELLCTDEPLPLRLRDHALIGSYAGMRECHLRPDLLLIYFKAGAHALVLVRMGSHSELF